MQKKKQLKLCFCAGILAMIT